MLSKRTRLALRLCAVAVAGLVLSELMLRCVLFCGWFDDTKLARSLRQPGLYAHPQQGDLHWILSSRWSGRGDESVPGYDPLLGWVGYGIRPPTYDHPDRALLKGRRPVLLFGDSYAQCNTPPEECFQAILEEHPLGATHRIVNYGMGAYGLDQIYLLLRASLDAWEKDRPLVLVSMMVDDDLDRAILSMRDWPKPRLRVKEGVLQIPDKPVPTVEAYHAQAPFVLSYLALRLRYNAISRLWNGYKPSEDSPDHDDALTAEKKALTRALLEAMEAELSSRGIPHAFVIFHNELAVDHPQATGWRDALARQVLDELGARWYSASEALLDRAEETHAAIADYYGREGPLIGHYNATGNEAASDCIVRAISDLEGIPVPPRQPLRAGRIHRTRTSEGGVALYATGAQAKLFDLPAEERRLVLVPGTQGPSELEYELGGKVASFGARVRHLTLEADAPGCGSIRLTILGDGDVLHERVYGPGDAPHALQVPLAGKQTLVLRADDAGDGRDCDRLVLGLPIFH